MRKLSNNCEYETHIFIVLQPYFSKAILERSYRKRDSIITEKKIKLDYKEFNGIKIDYTMELDIEQGHERAI